jgi:membrane protein DedA with SNARE-associated domain
MSRINIKKFNVFTLISLLAIIGGLGFYIYWGSKYGVWYDIGIYSITIVLVLPGVIGTILSLLEKPEEQS